MSTTTIEQEIAELKKRLEKLESKIEQRPKQRWREVVGTVIPNELTREPRDSEPNGALKKTRSR